MNPINPKTTLIPAKSGSLIVRAFLISLGLLMSHGVFAQTYQLGDTGPGGGIVFSVDTAGEHGLEAQAHDYLHNFYQSEFDWDIAIIVAAGYTNSAGLDCSNSLINPMCWHLPTKSELNLLYQHRTVVGGFFDYYYWSSTEYEISSAWNQCFCNGSQVINGKAALRLVRAVRAF